MMNNEEEDKIQSNQQILERLNKLSMQMEEQQNISEADIRSYVGLYVQRHSLSDDFFIGLCEHRIIQKLFGPTAKHIHSVLLLEIFNLLLANTSRQNNLVFIFSQTNLHEYLFDRFNISTQSSEAVEYFVQLLKTIILKISTHGNNSLIKLFCNNRYASFPLFTAVVTLASAFDREQLVRVTANQCLLQLIALINEKQVGRGYLTDLQMAVFFHELTCRMQVDGGSDLEGQLKYLADLLFALRSNPTSLSLLLSAFTNNVILPLLIDLPAILRLLRKLDKQVQDHGSFPQETYIRIKRVFLNIIGTFYFSKFTNCTYMAALKILNFKKISQPNILKLYQKRGQKIGSFLLQFDRNQQNEDEKILLYQSWVDFNSYSEQIQKIKEGRNKPKLGFFGSLFSKVDIQQQYVRRVLTAVGLNYDQLRFPLFKLSVSLNMKTGIYFVQQAITRRQERGEVIDRQKLDVHINDFKGKFQLSEEMCIEILYMLKKLKGKNVSMNEGIDKCPHQIEFQYRFLLKLRGYLLNTLGDYILLSQKEFTIREIAAKSLTIMQLGVPPLLDRRILQKIVWKLEQVQQEINDLTFANDFKKLIRYIVFNQEQQFLKIFDQNNEPYSPSPKSLVELKIFKYQFLRKIIDPSMQSIGQFVNREWCLAISQQEANTFTSKYPYKESGTLQVKPTHSGIILQLRPAQSKQEYFIKVKQEDPKIEGKDSSSLSFVECAQKVKMRDKEQAQEVWKSIERIRSFREEQMTKLIVQYFEKTYNKIRDKIQQRVK